MKNIYILDSIHNLKIFKKHQKKIKFISFENLYLNDIKIIEQISVTNISIQKKIENFSDLFLKEYLSLINKISLQNNNSVWWSSEMASRNPFTSQLPYLIQSFVNFDHIYKKFPNDIIVIYCKNNILKNFFIQKYKINKKRQYIKKNIKDYIPIKFKNFYSLSLQFTSLFIRIIKSRFILSKKFKYQDNLILIKSHFFEKQINDKNYVDEFFKDVYKYINQNFKVIILVHAHGNYNKICEKISKIQYNESLEIYPYEYFINLKDILFCFFKIFLFKLNLHNLNIYDLDLSSLIKNEFFRSYTSINSYAFYYSIRNLIKFHKNIHKTFLTYENRSWENMFIKSFRDHSINTKIIGYQHSVVYQASAGYYLCENDEFIKPLPDILLTNGSITREKILKYSFCKETFVKKSCALRYEYLDNFVKIKQDKISNILVPLEGVLNVSSFVDKVFELANNNPNLNFIIRPHPVLKWVELKNKISPIFLSLKNIKISKNKSIIDDLVLSNLCLYWSSAACIEAIKMGLPVIHFKMETTFSFDPLFSCKYLKWDIEDNDSFVKVINYINKIDKLEYKKLLQYSENYINEYLIKANQKKIESFVNE